MGKDLNDGNFGKKYLMVDKFFKVTYIKNQKKLLESDLYIGPEGVLGSQKRLKYDILAIMLAGLS